MKRSNPVRVRQSSKLSWRTRLAQLVRNGDTVRPRQDQWWACHRWASRISLTAEAVLVLLHHRLLWSRGTASTGGARNGANPPVRSGIRVAQSAKNRATTGLGPEQRNGSQNCLPAVITSRKFESLARPWLKLHHTKQKRDHHGYNRNPGTTIRR